MYLCNGKSPHEALDPNRANRECKFINGNKQARFVVRLGSKVYSHAAFHGEGLSFATLFPRERLQFGKECLCAGDADDLFADSAVYEIAHRRN